MKKNNPYLNFQDNCVEAMSFYKELFGGELTFMSVKDSPISKEFPAEAQDQIIHSQLINGDFVIMASGMMGASEKFTPGNTFSININCESEEEINKYFLYLSKEGKITCPLGTSFWGSTFGAVTDKYNTNWLMNYEKN